MKVLAVLDDDDDDDKEDDDDVTSICRRIIVWRHELTDENARDHLFRSRKRLIVVKACPLINYS